MTRLIVLFGAAALAGFVYLEPAVGLLIVAAAAFWLAIVRSTNKKGTR